MDINKALSIFRQNHRAVLATRRGDGRPQLSPVLQAVGNDGRILISTASRNAKARNARRDPKVSICALDDRFFGEWAQVDGTASIVEMPEAMELLRYTYRQISGEHPDWEEFDHDMVAQGRIVIAISAESAGPGGAGNGGGAS